MENKQQSIAMLETVATFAPNDVNLLAQKYGYYWPDNTDESRLSFLASLWQDKGDRVLADIARIHPDRQLILAASKEGRKSKKQKNTSRYNAADGTETKAPNIAISHGLTNRERLLIMIMILFAIALYIKFK